MTKAIKIWPAKEQTMLSHMLRPSSWAEEAAYQFETVATALNQKTVYVVPVQDRSESFKGLQNGDEYDGGRARECIT